MAWIGQTEPKGYPKAYEGTPRGEVCSKQKDTKRKGNLDLTRFPSEKYKTCKFNVAK